MKRIYLFLVLALIPVFSYTQDSIFFTFDTLNIEELVFKGRIPLNSQQVMGIYKSTELSSIDKINERLPGIYLISRGSYAKEPVMNGFSAGQINLTLDGMRMFGACTDKMDPVTSYVETDNLKSLEINHGSAGSKYGSNIGGSYDMVLEGAKLDPEKKVAGNAGVGYETVSKGKTGKIMLNLSGNRLAWRINAVARKNELYKDGNGELVDFSQYSKINLYNSLVFDIDDHQQLKADILIDKAYDVGYPALPMDVSNADGNIYALEYKKNARSVNEADIKAKIYGNTVYHLMDDSQRDSLFFIENPDGTVDSVYMKMDMPGWSNTLGGFLETNFYWGNTNQLYLKLDNYTNWVRAEMTMFMTNPENPNEPPMYAETWPDNYRSATGLYIQNRFSDLSKLSLDIGGRIEYNYTVLASEFGKQQLEVFGYSVEDAYQDLVLAFHINGNYKITSAGSIILKAGYNERLPSQAELFGFFLYNAYDGYDYIGNPTLNKERSVDLQLGFSLAYPKLRFNANAHYYHIFDYIFGVANEDIDPLNFYASGIKIYENEKYARQFAFNAEVEISLSEKLKLIDLTKLVYGQLHTSDPLPLMPPFQNILSLKWQGKRLDMMAETEYNAAQNRVNIEYGEQTSPKYFLLHFRANYKFLLSKTELRISAGVENILDASYSAHLDWGNYYRPGRNFYMMLNVHFKH